MYLIGMVNFLLAAVPHLAVRACKTFRCVAIFINFKWEFTEFKHLKGLVEPYYVEKAVTVVASK